MKVINPPTPFAYTVFCDEVRTEHTGKEIYIGVYNGAMILRELPMTVPSLTILIYYCEALNEVESNDIEINVWLPNVDEPIFRQLISRTDINAQRPPAPAVGIDDPDAFHFHQMKFAIELRPFTALAEGRVKVRVRVGEFEVRAPGLQLVSMQRLNRE